MKNYFRHDQTIEQSPTRVVILGSNGFVGRSLMKGLTDRSLSVRGISSQEIDLLQPDAVEKLRATLSPQDVLIFVSAITPDKGKDGSTFMLNLKMAQHVGQALGSTLLSHLIYLSSDAVFSDDLPPIDESTLAAPNSFHGLMHLARERMLAEAVESKKIPYLILRPCSLFGPGDTHGSYGPNRFMRTAVADKKIKLFGDGEEMRPHLYISDLVELVFRSLVFRTSGLIHVCPSPSVSFAQVARAVVGVMEQEVEIEHLPRTSPASHKHFFDSQLRRAFPGLALTGLVAGLQKSKELGFFGKN